MVKAALVPYHKNKSISKQEYRRLLGKIVCKVCGVAFCFVYLTCAIIGDLPYKIK